MAFAFTTVVPRRSFAVGSAQFSAAVPVNVSTVSVRASRDPVLDSWPDIGSNVLRISTEISLDGGLNFQFLVGFTAAGGALIDEKTGAPILESSSQVFLPDPTNPNRQVRITVDVFAVITTQLDIGVS